MGLFSGIRKWGAQRAFNRIESRTSGRRVMNFRDARKVGLLFFSQGESGFILVKQYVKYLRDDHGITDVMAFAYIDKKEAPHYHRHQLHFDYMTRADLNWWGVPRGDAFNQFIEEDYDLLIDLSPSDILPLMHVMKVSKAKFKVGRRNSEKVPYDLVVQVNEQSTFDKYLEQVNYFLTNINKHE